ncbi:MAG: hypothetical protein J6N53_17985 [Lachnospiraceae bacterium]|nr:hypothetical protein [Lachnospiraceae bacterium]
MIKSRYYHDRLTVTEQKLYDEIYSGMMRMAEQIRLSVTSFPDDVMMEHIYRAIRYDDPALFFIGGRYRLLQKGNEISIFPEYTYSRARVNEINVNISRKASELLSAVCNRAGRDAVEREKQLYLYFQRNFQYHQAAVGNAGVYPDSYTLLGPLFDKKAVCEGFSKAYMFLMNAMDINCICVSGKARRKGSTSQGHQWNIVWHNGKTYHTDVTWGISEVRGENYDYLDISDESIRLDHMDYYGVPGCSHKDLEYFGNKARIISSERELDGILKTALKHRQEKVEFRLAPAMCKGSTNTTIQNISEKTINIYRQLSNGAISVRVTSPEGSGIIRLDLKYT